MDIYTNISENSVIWESPSNIALVKYWGKRGNQYPINPSISFVLTKAKTTTKMSWHPRGAGKFSFDLIFNGEKKSSFHTKIQRHIEKLISDRKLYILDDYHYVIETSNTFPHSAGIASSASGMSALALCFETMLSRIEGREFDWDQVSAMARLGSGSACRSIFGSFSEWGIASHEYATPLKNINKKFRSLQDAIIIVDSTEKKISSSLGHALMANNPFRNARIDMAEYNTHRLLQALGNGDFTSFINVVENEALTLHAMMMTSDPGYLLLTPNTLLIINKIREYRGAHKIDMCFTLDAGPNIHLLYPEEEHSKVVEFLEKEVMEEIVVNEVIFDEVGLGPMQVDAIEKEI